MKVAVRCEGCGQEGRLDLSKVTAKTRCVCGANDIEMLATKKEADNPFGSPECNECGHLGGTHEQGGCLLCRCEREPSDILAQGSRKQAAPDTATCSNCGRSLTTDYLGKWKDDQHGLMFCPDGQPHTPDLSSQAASTDEVDESTDNICPVCGGTGNYPLGSTERCYNCGGDGKVARLAAIAREVRRHNPHLSPPQVIALAREAVRRSR